MKIIKEGTIPQKKKVVKFECKYCGCIFEAEKGEFDECDNIFSFYDEDKWYFADCPQCRQRVLTGTADKNGEYLIFGKSIFLRRE